MRQFIIFLLLSASPVVFAGQFWISGSLGGTTVAGGGLSPGISMAGTYQIGNYPITARLGATEGGGDLFDPATESLKERAILVGYQFPMTSSIVSIGLCQINGRHRGKLISQGFLSSTYEMNPFETTGIVLEYHGIKTFGSFFGVGLALSANLNKEIPFFSALMSLNLGKMTD
ncbi:hypothetical protein JYT44_02810 [Caldithrix abyssi]|nr:hypothetical protein [Caldithrix abyssi]